MTYELYFDPRALKEWQKLGKTVKEQFKKKLAKVLQNPRIEANRLSSFSDCYKIKLREAGYRLVYQVREKEIVVFVIAVGKREKNKVYLDAKTRLFPKG
ncbi:mRNA interferase RelE/StbE [Volucribacter psittacicida]|uniref:mRNA interferase RelE/StbE n=1 Tax=Volucribacter psittacicida TaxID=203482 RepID=A0A4R1FUI2_9PAST|nr:type II toxin-antitoxin system RelE/ParE family toxin [Volucribacter psittacicida]TCJ98423.1 mRNA interferase RelE/StbE [Volucribacter psittacicida]